MKGSMRQRGDSWQLRVYLGRDPVTGRQSFKTQTARGGKRDAQRALAKLIAETERGHSAGTNATVNELIQRWTQMSAPDWSPTTRRQHQSVVSQHIEPLLGNRKLRKLAPADLDWFYGELRKKPGRKTGTTLAPATIRRVYVVIRAALEQAVKWGWIPANPAYGSTPPKVRQTAIYPPDTESVGQLLRKVKEQNHPFFTYLRLAASTGARRSQLCGLRWQDINLDTGKVTFTHGLVDGDQGIVLKSTKSDRIYRVSLDSASLEALSVHRSHAEHLARECGSSVGPASFVFSYEVDGSEPWRPDGVTHRWIKWRSKVGLDEVRLHDLRHFMATTMLTAGVPISIVAGRLGHARSATTLNVYSHFVESGDQAAADLIADLVDEKPNEGEQSNGEVGQMLDRTGPDTKKPSR